MDSNLYQHHKIAAVNLIRSRRGLLITFAWLVLVLTACSALGGEQSMEAPAAEMSMAGSDSGGAAAAQPVESNDAIAAVSNTFQDGVPLARKMVARATMTVVVEDTDAIVAALQQELNALGGYVAQANLYRNSNGGDERLQGTMTLRIPATDLEKVMADLEDLAVEVRDKTISREDVTDQYSDVEAQLRNLEATEIELREMLAEVRAKPNAKPEDILTVYQHLTDIRGQIEQAQGRKNMYDNLVSLSTLDLTLTPNWATLPVVEEGWQPARTLRNASRELVSALQYLANAGIWIVVFLLPLLILLFIPLALVFLLWRAGIRRYRG